VGPGSPMGGTVAQRPGLEYRGPRRAQARTVDWRRRDAARVRPLRPVTTGRAPDRTRGRVGAVRLITFAASWSMTNRRHGLARTGNRTEQARDGPRART